LLHFAKFLKLFWVFAKARFVEALKAAPTTLGARSESLLVGAAMCSRDHIELGRPLAPTTEKRDHLTVVSLE
jgi:hypothetical protein